MITPFIDDPKRVGWKWCTVDQLVSPGPCFLLGIMLTASSAGAATATIRNGHNTGGEIVCVVGASASWTVTFPPQSPIYLDKGLFVDVGSNVTGVLVMYYQP